MNELLKSRNIAEEQAFVEVLDGHHKEWPSAISERQIAILRHFFVSGRIRNEADAPVAVTGDAAPGTVGSTEAIINQVYDEARPEELKASLRAKLNPGKLPYTFEELSLRAKSILGKGRPVELEPNLLGKINPTAGLPVSLDEFFGAPVRYSPGLHLLHELKNMYPGNVRIESDRGGSNPVAHLMVKNHALTIHYEAFTARFALWIEDTELLYGSTPMECLSGLRDYLKAKQ